MKAGLIGVLAAALLASAASPGFGAEANVAKMHSNPEPRDNLRVYAYDQAPFMTFTLDDRAPFRLDGMSVTFTRLEPGPHEATVTLPDGGHASLAFNLSNDALIESKGRHWWCLMAGRRDGKLTLFQAMTELCKRITDAGPD